MCIRAREMIDAVHELTLYQSMTDLELPNDPDTVVLITSQSDDSPLPSYGFAQRAAVASHRSCRRAAHPAGRGAQSPIIPVTGDL